MDVRHSLQDAGHPDLGILTVGRRPLSSDSPTVAAMIRLPQAQLERFRSAGEQAGQPMSRWLCEAGEQRIQREAEARP